MNCPKCNSTYILEIAEDIYKCNDCNFVFRKIVNVEKEMNFVKGIVEETRKQYFQKIFNYLEVGFLLAFAYFVYAVIYTYFVSRVIIFNNFFDVVLHIVLLLVIIFVVGFIKTFYDKYQDKKEKEKLKKLQLYEKQYQK